MLSAENTGTKLSGTLVIHKMCPYAQKTLIAAFADGSNEIDYESIDFGSKPRWLWKMNSLGQVPVWISARKTAREDFRGDEKCVVDSNCILDYFMETSSSAFAVASRKKAQEVTMFRALIGNLETSGRKFVQSNNASTNKALVEVVDEMERFVKERGGPYSCGEDFTVADAHALPFVSRLAESFDIPNSHTHPELTKWLSNGLAAEAYRLAHSDSWWWWW